MSQRFDDRDLLNRYLLGAASLAECEAVEERYFEDKSGLEEVLQAEDELIDDYVRRALTTAERVMFEENFLGTAARRQKLKFIQEMVATLASMQVGELVAAPNKVQGWPEDSTASQTEVEWGPLLRQVERGVAYRQGLFDSLLGWLDADRERAAEKYEAIRRRLIAIFISQGSIEAEELADETIDRVARKVSELMRTFSGEPATYFYGVARTVLLEHRRQQAGAPPQSEALITGARVDHVDDLEQAHKCLEKCLGQLSESNRELILRYYSLEKESKIGDRKDLAQSLGISLMALRVRAQRIRTSLQTCVTSCLEQARNIR